MPARRAALPVSKLALLSVLLLTSLIVPAGPVAAASPGTAADLARDESGAVPALPTLSEIQGAPAVSPPLSPALVPPVNWSSIGPYGGEIADVAASPTNPNLLLAGLSPADSPGTLFRSEDGGGHWSRVTALANNSVYDVEFSPTGVAYVGTTESVWKSTNGGTSWTRLNLGIGLNDQVFDVTIDPNNEAVLWVGVGDAQGTQAQTVLRSSDSGTTWTNRTPSMGTPISCKGIAIKPSDSNRIYACFGGAFGGGAFWVSTNAGVNWVNRMGSLPNRPMNDVIHDGARVLVCGGQLFGSQTFGLYASSNDGQTWTPLHAGWPSLVINDIAQDPLNPAVLLVGSQGSGVFKSTDSGTSWSYGIGGTGNLPVLSVRFAPASSSRILLGLSSLGIWQSADGGGTFHATNTGITGVNTADIASNPLNPLELAVAFLGSNDGGIYTSVDSGQNWSLEPVAGTRYRFVTFSPTGVLYAISDGPSSIAPEGVYRRNPDGSWTGLGPDQGSLFESELRVILFSPNNPSLILTAGNDFGVAGNEGTVWISTNAGGTWTKSYEGPSGDIVFDLAWVQDGTDTIALGAVTNYGGAGGALRTIDGGRTWTRSSSGLAGDARGNVLAAVPGQPQTFYYADAMYAIGSGGLYRTTNAGLTWGPTGLVGSGTVASVLCDPAIAGTLYVLRPAPDLVMISENNGSTFQAFNTGLSGAGYPNSIGYAGGETPELLFASTTGCYLTFLLTPAAVEGGNAGALSTIEAWPNPATVTSGVTFRIPAGPAADLRIYDARGALVRTLAAPAQTGREGSLFWDTRSAAGAPVSSGIYWARLGAEGRGCRIAVLR